MRRAVKGLLGMRAAQSQREAENPTAPLMGGNSINLLCAHRDCRRD
jgi:hypothetical protein